MAAITEPRLVLMGGAPTQGNLRTVRARAQDLQKSIDEVIYGLRFNAGVLKWDDIIRKYSVINTQLASLREALRPGTLDGFALLPRLVPDAGFAEAVTVQLASALAPEGEAAAAEAAAAVDAALGLGPEMPSMQRFEILNSAIEAHNSLISALTGPAGAGGGGGGGGGASAADGPLSAQSAPRKRQRELSDAMAAALQSKARAAAAAATALAAAMSGPPAAAATGGGRQQAAHTGPRRGPPGPAGGGAGGAAASGAAGGGGTETLDTALVFMLTGTR
ncbi:hypothetical protein VaNZ11_016127 [Volvox africanus]|uniref:Mediator complex subunit 8 n=1 Tax=Volvox africanus TaxID=51714 RepID=A0ABQ5SN10_9CHLO|nr:hypothetical protein VaNZ11_016127 [Volvox africanus]